MRRLNPGRLLAALLGLLAGPFSAWPSAADDSIAVVVGKAPPDIGFDRVNLADMFMKRIQVDDSRAAIAPLNLSATDPIREAFSLGLFGERPGAMQRYWTERYFHGISPPYTVNSQESMLRFVANTPGAIGYVASCRVDARVHVVAHLPIPAELVNRIHETCEKAAPDSD